MTTTAQLIDSAATDLSRADERLAALMMRYPDPDLTVELATIKGFVGGARKDVERLRVDPAAELSAEELARA